MNDREHEEFRVKEDCGALLDESHQAIGRTLLAIVAVVIALYFTVIRPASRQLSDVKRQLQGMQKTMKEIAGEKGTLDDTGHLLGLLSQQRRLNKAANLALSEIRSLHEQLTLESGQIQDALDALDGLATVKTHAIKVGRLSHAAEDALTTIYSLHRRLAAAGPLADKAKQSGEELLALQSELVTRTDTTDTAVDTLRRIDEVHTHIHTMGDDLDTAQQRVDDLVSLKDQVMGRTTNLADAIETLERTTDLQDQYQQLSQSFEHMRRWMLEVVLMEPTVERAVSIIRPLTELGNLRRLSSDELRHAAKAVSDHRQTQIADHIQRVPPLALDLDKEPNNTN